ncbi:MAG: lipopolysaccharide assembly protein LapA domain-containing protein, partial [Pseudonocardia sp.]|nr:lipopolysaccharide assembly protein LapA domain-containing protein [Pseudonocardia sp.]
IFILQNNEPMAINFLGFSGSLPAGVALLLAAIAGLLLVAIPGGLRILQLRRVARRACRED